MSIAIYVGENGTDSLTWSKLELQSQYSVMGAGKCVERRGRILPNIKIHCFSWLQGKIFFLLNGMVFQHELPLFMTCYQGTLQEYSLIHERMK